MTRKNTINILQRMMKAKKRYDHEDSVVPSKLESVVRIMIDKEYDPLEICIAKYQYLYDEEVMESCGTNNCALCIVCEFTSVNRASVYCTKCDIYKHTKKLCCIGTPYQAMMDAFDDSDEIQLSKYVKDELDFLNEVYEAREKNKTGEA